MYPQPTSDLLPLNHLPHPLSTHSTSHWGSGALHNTLMWLSEGTVPLNTHFLLRGPVCGSDCQKVLTYFKAVMLQLLTAPLVLCPYQ